VQLIDAEGTVLHRWRIDPLAIWADDPYADEKMPKEATSFLRSRQNYVHGTYLFDNGDLLCNVEFLGLARLDARGEVVWRLDHRTHHSIHRAENGNFWVCETTFLVDEADTGGRFPGLVLPAREDAALEVTPDGEVVRRLSILEALYRSPYLTGLFRHGPPSDDPLHLNDVEPLPSALADEYPMFEAGDLLVSMRQIDTVMVVDPDDGTVRWANGSSWFKQHDPDWLGDGWISVYDNGLGFSRIARFRPHTGEYGTIYPTPASTQPFYSVHGGKAQRLDDGHWVITEPQGARVFEIDDAGREIWSFVQTPLPGGDKVAEVLEGTRYPWGPERLATWKAPR
jgi:hypothetical protein